jgi:hypothetical protein
MPPRISVVTPTGRWGGIDIWWSSLRCQTFTDFEAILVDEHYGQRKDLIRTYVGLDPRIHVLPPPPIRPGKFWNLSEKLNRGVAYSQGELVVFLQDYIWLTSDALQQFWDRYQQEPKAIISGVGHKYQKPDWAVNLQGAITIFTESGFDEGTSLLGHSQPLGGVWERDPRIQGRGFHLCNPIEWEGNYGSVPRDVVQAIGGFDEDFDAGWGYDNVNFAERALAAGYPCWLDEENECYAFSHELLFAAAPGEWKNRKPPNNEQLWRRKVEQLQWGEAYWRVPYLAQHETLLRVGVDQFA